MLKKVCVSFRRIRSVEVELCIIVVCLYITPEDSEDMFEQYLTQLLHSTRTKSHLPPIQRGQHHVFSAEHTTRDILSLMAQVQGLNLPSESAFKNLVERFGC